MRQWACLTTENYCLISPACDLIRKEKPQYIDIRALKPAYLAEYNI